MTRFDDYMMKFASVYITGFMLFLAYVMWYAVENQTAQPVPDGALYFMCLLFIGSFCAGCVVVYDQFSGADNV